MKKNFRSNVARVATAGALLATCGLAQAQVVLFDAGSSNQCQFNAAVTTLGWTSGAIAGGPQRWFAAPFHLGQASVITEIDYNCFDVAGSEYLRVGYGIWTRPGGDPGPLPANEVFVSGVNPPANTDFEAPTALVQDPRQPTGTTFQRKLVLTNPKALPAGDYYLSLFVDGLAPANTSGFPQNAWATNSQEDTTFCPVNTPIALAGNGPNNRGFHGWRALSYPAPGFVVYDNPVTQLDICTPAIPPAWGELPQEVKYLWTPGFTIIGTTAPALVGACCLSAGGCSPNMLATACCAGGGLYKGNGSQCATAGCPAVGACCKDDGTCLETTQATCIGAANLGEYGGDNSHCPALGGPACPALGACCLENGTCILGYQLHCTSQGGLYRGNGITCASAGGACAPFGIVGDDLNSADVGDTLAGATPVTGYGEALNKIHGYIGLGDRADIYKIKICKRDGFSASTVGNGNTLDNELALFDSTGKGLSFDDDTGTTVAPITQSSSQSIVTGQLIPVGNTQTTFYLAISEFNNTTGIATASLPLDAAGAAIFTEPSPWSAAVPPTGGTGWPEWAPNGPSATQILNASGVGPAWSVDPDTFGNYTITLTGACFLGCYANCDQSTASPLLTSNDFQCFLNSFAGQGTPTGRGYGYANCDGSVAQPILNANDFQCFLNAYAAGCNT